MTSHADPKFPYSAPYASPSPEHDPPDQPPPTPQQSAALQRELASQPGVSIHALHPLQDQVDMVTFIGEPDAQAKLIEGLAKATSEGEFDKIKKDKVGQIGNLTFKYAPLQNILEVVRIPLAKQGLCLLQCITGSPLGPNYTRVTSMVCGHGARIQAVFDFDATLFREDKGAGSPAQRLGKTWTYLRRMQLQALLCLAGDTDDDEALGEGPKRSNKQATPSAPARAAKPAEQEDPEKPAVGRVVRSRTTTVKRSGGRKPPQNQPPPPPLPPVAGTIDPPVDDSTPEGAREGDWPDSAFVPPDAPTPTDDPAPVHIPEADVHEVEVVSAPKEEIVLLVTQEQKDTLRALCQTAGLHKTVKINAFVRGQCGEKINAGNLNGAQADSVIGALRKLIASQQGTP